MFCLISQVGGVAQCLKVEPNSVSGFFCCYFMKMFMMYFKADLQGKKIKKSDLDIQFP